MKVASFVAVFAIFVPSLALLQAPSFEGNSTIEVIDDAPAAPSASADAQLVKRAPPETVILANCDPSSSFGSYFLYYNAGHNTQGAPDAQCIVRQNSFVTWEGRDISCRFSSGVTFTSQISRNAQNGTADYTVVGSGFNDFHGFTCRKDDKHVLWSGSGFSCRTIYYCQP